MVNDKVTTNNLENGAVHKVQVESLDLVEKIEIEEKLAAENAAVLNGILPDGVDKVDVLIEAKDEMVISPEGVLNPQTGLRARI